MRSLGYAILVLGLPLAVLGMLAPPNEYSAMGGGGIDCDGPLQVLLFAGPAFAIYAGATLWNGIALRRPRNLVIAGLALLLCVGLGINLARAWQESRINAGEAVCG